MKLFLKLRPRPSRGGIQHWCPSIRPYVCCLRVLSQSAAELSWV